MDPAYIRTASDPVQRPNVLLLSLCRGVNNLSKFGENRAITVRQMLENIVKCHFYLVILTEAEK